MDASSAADDAYVGTAGVDTLDYSGAAAPVTVNLTLTGPQNTFGAGDDTISAFENLIGTAGKDTFTGNAAGNRLEGGRGADKLTGGLGADTFVYKAGDSGVFSKGVALGGSMDTIFDFSAAQGDKIDLTGFSRVTFAAVGDHYEVYGDVNGDGVTDLAITVSSAAALTAADFVL